VVKFLGCNFLDSLRLSKTDLSSLFTPEVLFIVVSLSGVFDLSTLVTPVHLAKRLPSATRQLYNVISVTTGHTWNVPVYLWVYINRYQDLTIAIFVICVKIDCQNSQNPIFKSHVWGIVIMNLTKPALISQTHQKAIQL
jgi:hypothetical protein